MTGPTCEEKSCCWSWRPSLRSHDLTVLSKPPVQSLVPSAEMSIQDAPSVWPWNCLTSVWLCRSQTAILPSEQQLKQTCKKIIMKNNFWISSVRCFNDFFKAIFKSKHINLKDKQIEIDKNPSSRCSKFFYRGTAFARHILVIQITNAHLTW